MKMMTKEIELAKQHGIQYRLTPEGTTEMWCHDRNVQAFAEALMAAERERCAMICDKAAEMAWSRWEIRADQFDQGAAAEAEKLAEEIRKVQALEQRRAVPAA